MKNVLVSENRNRETGSRETAYSEETVWHPVYVGTTVTTAAAVYVRTLYRVFYVRENRSNNLRIMRVRSASVQ